MHALASDGNGIEKQREWGGRGFAGGPERLIDFFLHKFLLCY